MSYHQAKQKAEKENKEIIEATEPLVDEYYPLFVRELSYQFGKVLVKQAELDEIKWLLKQIVRDASRATAGVISNSRLREAQQNTATMLKAVMAGCELERRGSSEKENDRLEEDA